MRKSAIKPLAAEVIHSLTVDGLASDPLPPDYSIYRDTLVGPHLAQSHMRVHLYTFVALRSFEVICIHCVHCTYIWHQSENWHKCVHLPWFRPCRWCCHFRQFTPADWLRTCDVFRWVPRVRFATWCTPAGVFLVWFQVLCRCHTAIGSWCECWGLWQSPRNAPWLSMCSTSGVSRASWRVQSLVRYSLASCVLPCDGCLRIDRHLPCRCCRWAPQKSRLVCTDSQSKRWWSCTCRWAAQCWFSAERYTCGVCRVCSCWSDTLSPYALEAAYVSVYWILFNYTQAPISGRSVPIRGYRTIKGLEGNSNEKEEICSND